MTKKTIDVAHWNQIPEYDSKGVQFYTWGHIYALRCPKIKEFHIKNSDAYLPDIFNMYDADNISYERVYQWEQEVKPTTEYRYDRNTKTPKKKEYPGGQIKPFFVYDLTSTIRVHCYQYEKRFTFHIMGELEDDLEAPAKWIRDHFPKAEHEDNEIPFEFMYLGEYSAETHDRNIVAQPWQDIRANYAEKAQEQLDKLVAFQPDDSVAGKIGILLGPPGTGKTHLIRALAYEWRDWASFKYVLDTERLFKVPSYMLEVILKAPEDNKWNVILCEDAEEYIAPDSKAKIGQALARLLNLGDGLIGQGLRILMLFTTNAPDAELHQAITRKGRCFVKAHVPLLSGPEATKWLADHGKTEIMGESSIAELYATLAEEEQIVVKEEERKVGFGQYV